MTKSTASRRRFISCLIGGLGGIGFSGQARSWFAPQPTGAAKRCIVLWMNGGPSQFETFDPKPGTSTGGPTSATETDVKGVQIAENLPQLAKRMKHLCPLRNITSREGAHDRGQYYLHTGFRPVPAFPRPALGSVLSHELPENDAPKYVVLGNRVIGPAYCGPDHAAFEIGDVTAAKELLSQVRLRRDDIRFLQKLGADFDKRNNFPTVARRRSMIDRIERLVATPFREALDLEKERAQTRARYGDHEFGKRCLAARRLLERGVPFVEVQLAGWDTHTNNFDQSQRLCAAIDGPWSALIDDLIAGGLWHDTLLVWMGEFGRTPAINGQSGRDHFPAVTPVVLGGGCIKTGQVIGATNRTGQEIREAPNSVSDLAATMLHLLGIEPDREFETTFGSPTKATDDGKVIAAVKRR